MMGKSVKKTPICNDQYSPHSRWAKRQASKAVRRYAGEPGQGKWYRKAYCSYNICDYRFYQTVQQAVHEWETGQRWVRALTRHEVIQSWAKCYKRK